jgi:hypothetical protein
VFVGSDDKGWVEAPARIIETATTPATPTIAHTAHKEAQAPQESQPAPVEPPTQIKVQGQEEYDKVLNELLNNETDIATDTPSDAVRISFHVEGNRLFGKDWDKGARAWLCELYTKNKTPNNIRTSSKELVNSELKTLTENMQDKAKGKTYAEQYAKKNRVSIATLDANMHSQLVAAAA